MPRPEDRSEGATITKVPQEENQPSRTTVETLQLEFVEWLRRYQPTLRRAPFGSDRLKNSPRQIPAAEWFGAMAKCCYFVETLVAACLKQLLPIAGTRGVEMVEKVGDGKPLDLLTLGQRVQILCALDKSISLAFWQLCPEMAWRKAGGSRLLGKSGVNNLQKLSRMRNDFAHGRWYRDQAEAKQFAADFPDAVTALCGSQLVCAAIALEGSTKAVHSVGSIDLASPHDSGGANGGEKANAPALEPKPEEEHLEE